MLRLVLLLALAALAPRAQAAALGTPPAQTRWTSACAVPPWDTNATTYALTSDTAADGCIWTLSDGSTAQALPDEIDLFLRDLDSVTEWLRLHGFREPTLSRRGGRFLVVVAPPGQPWCHGDVCGTPIDGVTLQPTDADTSDEVLLAVSADGLVADTYVYQVLMTATQFAYEGYSASDPCAPACWASKGFSVGFARWWRARLRGRQLAYGDPTRFGRALAGEAAVHERIEGGRTGPFWEHIAGEIGRADGHTPESGFAYAHEVYMAAGDADDPLQAVDGVLSRPTYGFIQKASFGGDRGPRPTSGLSIAYSLFASFYRWMPMAEPMAPLRVPAGETAERTVTHAPVSIVRIPVEIPDADPQTTVTVRVRDASDAIAFQYGNREGVGLALLRLGPDGEAEWASSPSLQRSPYCPDGGPCSFTVALSNTDPRGAHATAAQTYRVEVEVGTSCQLPGGVEGLAYTIHGPDAETGRRTEIARIDYELSRFQMGRGMTPDRVEGRIAMRAGPIPVETGFEGRLTCTETLFAVRDLEFDNPALDLLAEPLGAALRSNRLELPARARVGSRVDDVVGEAAVGIGADAAARSDTWMHDLRITGQERRRIEGLDRALTVWKIEGRTSGAVRFDGETMTGALEQAGATFDPEQRRAAVGSLGRMGGQETDTPVTIYYSPEFGAVETVSGSGPSATVTRLVRVRRGG